MANDFIIYALICGIGIALSLCPIGCVVLWKRMTFLGDAIAHSATLGVILGIVFSINTTYTILLVSILFVLVIMYLKKHHTSDTLVAIFSHSFLAIGLVIISVLPYIRVDIMSYLFGDLLMVDTSDIIVISVLTTCILMWLYGRWKLLLSAAINEDLAIVEGINTKALELEFMLIMAILISLSIKIVGILLISSLLVVPAASARNLSQTPKQMMLYSIIFGLIAVIMGIMLSAFFDIPSGPAIVVSAICIFSGTLFIKQITFAK
jgi:zinc transport system permease protein